jgi:hypothetical protein
MVRGSGLRVTELDRCGDIPDTVRFATSKSVIRVRVNEVVEAAQSQLLRADNEEPRVRLAASDETIRYTVDIDFIRVDPGVLSLVSGVPVVINAAGNIAGFDSQTKLLPVSFGLEVWTRLAGTACVGGEREYGYTLFPYLKGGRLGGFTVANNTVSFNLTGAQTRRLPRWGVGPYDITGPWERLLEPITAGVNWRTFKTTFPPPEQADGVQEFEDIVEGGSASSTSADILDGEFVVTSGWIVDGGGA